MRFRTLFGTLGVTAALLGTASCWPELDEYRDVTLSTHVQDWRDEVVYQLLVDRFADGDTSNNLRVDRTSSVATRAATGRAWSITSTTWSASG